MFETTVAGFGGHAISLGIAGVGSAFGTGIAAMGAMGLWKQSIKDKKKLPSLALVMVGMLQPYWFFPHLIPAWLNNKIVLFFLATPIVLGPGRQFFVNSWNGLRRGVTDMNLLYATGIGAAYGLAVVNTFWPDAGFGGKEATRFRCLNEIPNTLRTTS